LFLFLFLFPFPFLALPTGTGTKEQTAKSQHTIRFHVDDLMSSHVNKKVNGILMKWLNKKYGKFGAVKATVTFDYSEKGKVKIDMIDYMASMIDDAPGDLKPTEKSETPAADDLFAAGDSPPLDPARAEEFHTIVAKGLFACKREESTPRYSHCHCLVVHACAESKWR
jgi:hypothetical protein